MNYQHNNVTRYLPDAIELRAYFDERKGKASKTRFINETLAQAYDQRADLVNALERSPNGMLYGATHTKHDLLVYDRYISNILNLKK
jgi:hypothetical protein